MISLATFNANNLFLRYRFKETYPGDQSKKSADKAAQALGLGFLPGLVFRNFPKQDVIIWDSARRKSTAQALKAGDGKLPDILCLQEVESMAAIRLFNRDILGGYYKHFMLVDSLDERLIDVAVMSVYPIFNVRSHVDDLDKAGKPIFSRDCLEASINLPKGETLHLYVNHFKSKLSKPGNGKTKQEVEAEAHAKRQKQAETVRDLVKRNHKGQDAALFAVVGDFNDTPTSPSVAALTMGNPLLTSVLDLLPVDQRHTYFYRGPNRVSQIDYILASKALLERIKKAAGKGKLPLIERSGMSFNTVGKSTTKRNVNVSFFEPDSTYALDANGEAPASIKQAFDFPRLPEVEADPLNPISDHAPVKIWF